MSDWELLDDGSFNGVRKYIRSSGEDHGTVQIRYEGHDVPLIVDRNKREQADNAGTRMGEMERVASIPCSVLYDWLTKHGVWAPNDPEFTRRMLNDPDYRYLKCRDIII